MGAVLVGGKLCARLAILQVTIERLDTINPDYTLRLVQVHQQKEI